MKANQAQLKARSAPPHPARPDRPPNSFFRPRPDAMCNCMESTDQLEGGTAACLCVCATAPRQNLRLSYTQLKGRLAAEVAQRASQTQQRDATIKRLRAELGGRAGDSSAPASASPETAVPSRRASSSALTGDAAQTSQAAATAQAQMASRLRAERGRLREQLSAAQLALITAERGSAHHTEMSRGTQQRLQLKLSDCRSDLDDTRTQASDPPPADLIIACRICPPAARGLRFSPCARQTRWLALYHYLHHRCIALCHCLHHRCIPLPTNNS